MMIGDDVSEPSSPESAFDETDLLNSSMHDDVTAQLAAAGIANIGLFLFLRGQGHFHFAQRALPLQTNLWGNFQSASRPKTRARVECTPGQWKPYLSELPH